MPCFDASPFSVNGQEVPKPSYAKERFSFQIGGPLMIPKLFKLENTTFASQLHHQPGLQSGSQLGTVPTLGRTCRGFFGSPVTCSTIHDAHTVSRQRDPRFRRSARSR